MEAARLGWWIYHQRTQGRKDAAGAAPPPPLSPPPIKTSQLYSILSLSLSSERASEHACEDHVSATFPFRRLDARLPAFFNLRHSATTTALPSLLALVKLSIALLVQ